MAEIKISFFIDQIREIKTKYLFEESDLREINETLREINSDLNKTKINVGIIGELSSGKSTFINSILREDVLKVEVIEGTTTSATWIDYGEAIDVEIETENTIISYRNDGMSTFEKILSFFNLSSQKEEDMIRSFIAESTSNFLASQAKIEKIKVLHPTEILKKITMIDTPGINSQNQSHQNIIMNTIKKDIDTCIVLTPAVAVMPETLANFIKKNLTKIKHRLVVVVTKTDMLEDNNIKFQKETTNIIKTKLNCQNIPIFFMSPKNVLSDIQSNQQSFNVDIFLRDEEKMFEYLLEQKNLLSLEKSIRKISDIYIKIQNILISKKDDFSKMMQIEIDRSANLPNTKEFFVKEKTEISITVEPLSNVTKSLVDRIFQEIFLNLQIEIKSDIQNIQDKNALNLYIHQGLPNKIQMLKNNIYIKMNDIESQQNEILLNIYKEFKNRFIQTYQSIIDIKKIEEVEKQKELYLSISKLNHRRSKLNDSTNPIAYQNNAISFVKHSQESSIDLLSTSINTIIDALPKDSLLQVIGNFIANIFEPSLESLKSEVNQNLNQNLNLLFQNNLSQFHAFFQNKTIEALSNLDGFIDEFLSICYKNIEDYLNENQKSIQKYQTAIMFLDEDLTKIATIQHHLQESYASLSSSRD